MSAFRFDSEVAGDHGIRGTLFAAGTEDRKLLRLADGREFLVPGKYIRRRSDGAARVLLKPEELERFAARERAPDGEAIVIPAIAEQLEVSKQEIETGSLRVHKAVNVTEATVDEPLASEQFEVKRVPVNRPIDGPAEIRHEGDTVIIPLVEEILVVEKRLMLREEVHVTRRREEVRKPQTTTVRREDVTIERTEPKSAG